MKYIILISLLVAILITVTTVMKSKEANKKKVTSPQSDNEEVPIVMKQYEFIPNPIRLKLNRKVRLKLTTLDMPHSIYIPKLNLMVYADIPNKPVYRDFIPKQKGEFQVECSIMCGDGHMDMKAKLIVE